MNTKKSNFISLLLSILGIEIVFCAIYGSFSLMFSACILAGTIFLYKMYDLVYTKGAYVYIALMAVVIISVLFLLGNVKGETVSFSVWLLSGGTKISTNMNYIISAAIIITFSLSTMFYYFTINIVRTSVLLLLYMIVIIFYIKGSFQMSSIIIYLFIASYIAQFMQYSKENHSEDKVVKVKNKSMYKTGGTILLIVFIIALIIPKPGSLPKMEFLDKTKDYINGTVLKDNTPTFDISDSKDRSINKSIKENEDVELFSISKNTDYLVYNVLEKYEDESWSAIDSLNSYEKKLGDINLEYDTLQDKIASSKKIKTSWLKEVQENKSQNLEKLNTVAISFNMKVSSMEYLPHPINTVNASDINNDELYINKDVIYGNGRVNGVYNISYYNDTPQSKGFRDWILKNSSDDVMKTIKNETSFNEDEFKEYSFDGKSRYIELPSSIDEEVYTLTNEIVKDKNTYYDKAKAIESYLRNGDYEYSLSLPGSSRAGDYINYFILDGKKGYCVQFATAMTLMCRAANLEARYVEGYYVDEEDNKGAYYSVNAKRAHAFVEVHIPGYGWKIFDPTTSIMAEDSNNSLFNFSAYLSYAFLMRVFTVVVAILILIAAIYIILRLTKRKRKIFKILHKDNESAFEDMMAYTIELADSELLKRYKEETLLQYADRLDYKYNLNLLDLVKIYYAYKYNDDGKITKENINSILNININIFKKIKEKLKK